MATTQVSKQAECNDHTGKPGTSVLLETNMPNLLRINGRSRVVTLTQEPNETLSLDYSIEPAYISRCPKCLVAITERNLIIQYCANCKNLYDGMHENISEEYYVSSFSLTFDNNLHEMSQDYGYKIEFKALIDNGNNVHRHMVLFAHEEMRSKSVIANKSICDMRMIQDCSVIHACVNITRFSKNVSTVKEHLLASSDVSLVVGNDVFPAHKYVLASKSNAFKAMFTHRIEENLSVVKVDGFDSEVIEEVLFYIYTGQTKNLLNISEEVYKAAHKYEISELQSTCVESFIFNLNCKNVINILDLANLYELQDLENTAMSFIKNHEEEMVKENRYQIFLCRNLKVDTIISTLKLSEKYDMDTLKLRSFEFVKKHSEEIVNTQEFFDLFSSNPMLMKAYLSYIHNK